MSRKSKNKAALLSFFLGGMGVHRYYLGYKIEGFVQTCGAISILRALFDLWSAGLAYGSVSEYIMYGNIYQNSLLVARFVFGAATGIWAFVDFIRILTKGLRPANGGEYVGEIEPKAALLSYFLGGFGVHRFYLGYSTEAVIQLIGGICRTIVPLLARLLFGYYIPKTVRLFLFLPNFFALGTRIWAFVDLIQILDGKLRPKNSMSLGNQLPAPEILDDDLFDSIELLDKLAKLHEQGVLSNEEFAQKKEALLKKM